MNNNHNNCQYVLQRFIYKNANVKNVFYGMLLLLD